MVNHAVYIGNRPKPEVGIQCWQIPIKYALKSDVQNFLLVKFMKISKLGSNSFFYVSRGKHTALIGVTISLAHSPNLAPFHAVA